MGKEEGCLVKNLLTFEAQEDPPWHQNAGKSVRDMLKEIMDCHKRWQEAQCLNTYDDSLVQNVKYKFLVKFIYHINLEEEVGLSTLQETDASLQDSKVKTDLNRSLSIKEQETVNLRDAYLHLLEKVARHEESSDYGLLETSLLKEVHSIILKDIPTPSGFTRPGELCKNSRECVFEGEVYKYPNPEDMEGALGNLLDYYNLLFDFSTKGGLQDIEDYYKLFKTCAWSLFELLDLHPFGDGNGRLCRLLCSYSLSLFTPFPTPIYNVWTESRKHDYIKALVEARKSTGRKPLALTTMIIECNWCGWKEFFDFLDRSSANDTVCR